MVVFCPRGLSVPWVDVGPLSCTVAYYQVVEILNVACYFISSLLPLVLRLLSGGAPNSLPFIRPSQKPCRPNMGSVLTMPCLVRGNRPGKPVQLQEYEIKYLCTKAREIFINQPILLELEAPIKICGASTVPVTQPQISDHTAQGTFMGNTMIYFDYLNTAAFPRKRTTSSSVTTSTAASSL